MNQTAIGFSDGIFAFLAGRLGFFTVAVIRNSLLALVRPSSLSRTNDRMCQSSPKSGSISFR